MYKKIILIISLTASLSCYSQHYYKKMRNGYTVSISIAGSGLILSYAGMQYKNKELLISGLTLMLSGAIYYNYTFFDSRKHNISAKIAPTGCALYVKF